MEGGTRETLGSPQDREIEYILWVDWRELRERGWVDG